MSAILEFSYSPRARIHAALIIGCFGSWHLWSVRNMDLAPPLSSGCNVTEPLWGDLGLLVKEEDIKEEEYGHMVACPDEEEKPFAELHCKTETDVTDFNYESLQTTVKIEVKIEEDEHDYLLENVNYVFQQGGLRNNLEELVTKNQACKQRTY
ncbi:uncharacterized protein LOC125297316 isoform X3 [Alosa alosa]|uniref:uncharacterized protein LOC125297316 isoform X3 n=1 Tax=Alosa alosa TaxID=278164 RepID=UPI0020155040|nr:uncharacterized protein LOC125297316 isoform X3 [Alosa alosa]